MLLEGLHAHIEPAVVSPAATARIRLVSDDEGTEWRPGDCEVTVHPLRGFGQTTTVAGSVDGEGAVAFDYAPTTLGECSVTVRFPYSPAQRCGSFYVVEPALAGLQPLRGDLHTHTWYSDGRSSPLALLRRAVDQGLDFLAVTDHNNYDGSAEAQSLAPALSGALTIVPGEEVTFDRGHIVAVGTSGSVASGCIGPEFEQACATIADERGPRLAGEGVPVDQYARAVSVAQRIRGLGGLAIVAHPFWVADGEYHLDWRITSRLLRDREVDGVELLGDVEFEENLLSIAGYMELLAQGVATTVVGNSDTHGVEHTFGRYWSVVFARDNSPAAILDALRQRRSVACVRLPEEQLRIYGPLDLVQYAYFLHRSYFPPLDAAATAQRGDYAAVAAIRAALSRRLLHR
ncbi:MAG: PHP domain-containing protein [Anaerolineae bacterium]